MTPKSVRIALVQKPPVFLNRGASIDRAVAEIAAAADSGAQIIAFSECWLPGYPVWVDEAPGAALWEAAGPKQLYRLLSENAVSLDDAGLEPLREAAARYHSWIVMGAHERLRGTLYNTMLFFSPAGLAAWHRKLVPTYTERLLWGRGDGSTLGSIETPAGTLGGLICWEHWMPLARAAMHAKGETVHVAQWPTVNEAHQLASRHYAFEGRCYVLASGCLLSKGDVLEGFDSLPERPAEARSLLESISGDDDRLLQHGGSCVAGPDGHLLSTPVFDTKTHVIADLDLERLTEEQMTLDTAGHYSRPDIFQLHVNTEPQTGVSFREALPGDG